MSVASDPRIRQLQEWARHSSTVFFTYLERASLLGLLFALIPHRDQLMAWDGRPNPELWSWQFLVAILGAVILVAPLLVEVLNASGKVLGGARSLPEAFVRAVGVAVGVSAAIVAMGVVVASVADLLANLVD